MRRRDAHRLAVIDSTKGPRPPAAQDFIDLFTGMLSHATATVVANPDAAFPPGTLGHSIRRASPRLSPALREAIAQRGKRRLSEPMDLRRKRFGSYAERGPEVWQHVKPGLDPRLRRAFRAAVRSVVDIHRAEIVSAIEDLVATKPLDGSAPFPKTTVQVLVKSGDVVTLFDTEFLEAPAPVQFQWHTTEDGAERGVWHLYLVGAGGNETLLDTGDAGKAGPPTVFEIDFGKYLSPVPPAVPAKYHVRVTPGTNPKQVPTDSPGETKTVPGKAVGAPSEPATVRYGISQIGPQEFDFTEVYQGLRFSLDRIRMLEDQSGPGAEEFHVACVVQEMFPLKSDQLGAQDILEDSATLDNDFSDPEFKSSEKLSGQATFFLNSPSSTEWPRGYVVVTSVIEEDSGGAVADWEKSLLSVAQTMLSDAFTDEVGDALGELFDEFSVDQAEAIAQAGSQIANLVGSIFGMIGGFIGVAVGWVVYLIIVGSDDDLYETSVSVLVLPSNETQLVHLAESGAAFPHGISSSGSKTADGFLLKESVDLRGYASFPDATDWDGKVRIHFSWRFQDKTLI